MSSLERSSKTLRTDFAEAFAEDSQDEAEIDQLMEEHDLSDPDRTKIKPLRTVERLKLFERFAGGK